MSDWPTETQSSDRGDSGGIDIRRLFFGHKIILILAVAAGCAFGYVKFTKAPPVYASSAAVLVAKDDLPLPMEGAAERAMSKDPLDTHIALMSTPIILANAVEDGNLDQLPSFAGSSNPAARLAGGLSVSRSAASGEILNLSFQGSNRYDCEKVLNAVISAYIKFVAESQEKLNSRTVRLIEDARDGLFGDLEKLEEEYAEFRDRSALLWNGDEGVNIHQLRVREIDSAMSLLKREKMLIRAELEAIQDGLDRGQSRDAILMMALNRLPERDEHEPVALAESMEAASVELPVEDIEGAVLANAAAIDEALAIESSEASLSAKLLPLLVEEQRLLETHGRQHPKVIAIQREIATTRRIMRDAAAAKIEAAKRAEKRRQELREKLLEERRRRAAELLAAEKAEKEGQPIVVEAVDSGPDLLQTFIESRQQELAVLAKKEAHLKTEFETQQEAAKIVSTDTNRNRVLREEIQRKKRLFDVLMEELQELSLVKDGNFLAVEMIAAPGPGRQVAPVLGDNLALGGVLGLLAGIGIAFLLEMSDRSFRGPEQISQMLKLPVVGHIPTITGRKETKKDSKLDKTLVAYHRGKSRLAESYRAVRVPLLFGAKQQGIKVLQVTSPDPGDGKSTLAANLAIVMANSGKRTILIDSDFRRPKVHKLFGLSNETGFSAAITGQAELHDSITSCEEVENLDLLPTGPKLSNAAEIILSPGV